MKHQSMILKIISMVIASMGLSVGIAHAQVGQEIYYEGRSWNQFYGQYDYFQGDASTVCATSIRAWDKTDRITWLNPQYIRDVRGIYKGVYEVRQSPPYTFPYILCEGSLKTRYIYPENSDLNNTHIIEDFGNVVKILSERDVTEDCQSARETSLQDGTPLPEYCREFPLSDPLCYAAQTYDALGGVACKMNGDTEIVTSCFWPENMDSTSRNPQARQIIRDCVIEHENVHGADSSGYCNTDNGRFSFNIANGDLANSEKNGYAAEYACLQRRKDECQTSQCLIDIIYRQAFVAERNRENGGHL